MVGQCAGGQEARVKALGPGGRSRVLVGIRILFAQLVEHVFDPAGHRVARILARVLEVEQEDLYQQADAARAGVAHRMTHARSIDVEKVRNLSVSIAGVLHELAGQFGELLRRPVAEKGEVGHSQKGLGERKKADATCPVANSRWLRWMVSVASRLKQLVLMGVGPRLQVLDRLPLGADRARHRPASAADQLPEADADPRG